jgi:hypothetical protein
MLDTFEAVNETRVTQGRETVTTLVGYTFRAKEIARQLRVDLGRLSVPDTEAGREADRWLELDTRRAIAILDEEGRRVRKLPLDITHLQSIRAFDGLELALGESFGAMTTVNGTIAQAVPELRTAFEKAGSCMELDRLRAD